MSAWSRKRSTNIGDEDLASSTTSAMHAHAAASSSSIAAASISTAATAKAWSASAETAALWWSLESWLCFAVLRSCQYIRVEVMLEWSTHLANVDQPSHKRCVAQAVDSSLSLVSRGVFNNSAMCQRLAYLVKHIQSVLTHNPTTRTSVLLSTQYPQTTNIASEPACINLPCSSHSEVEVRRRR